MYFSDDAPPSGWIPYAIGSLAFLGRTDDALALYAKHSDAWPPASSEAFLCRFALGMGLVRLARYDDGVRFLVENLRTLRQLKPRQREHQGFYAWQGVAFYRFFQCRYGRALKAAKNAHASALMQNFHFGLALAADMRAHALMRSGQISAGIVSFQEAIKLAEKLGNGSFVRMFQTMLQNYLASVGRSEVPHTEAIATLKATLLNVKHEDNFSRAATQVDLARLLCMTGQLNESERYLQQATQTILASSHRRLKMFLLHRLAFNRYLMGRFREAYTYLDQAKQEIDARFDVNEQLFNLGLRARVIAYSQQTNLPEGMAQQLRALTLRSRSGLACNILRRETGDAIIPITPPGEDLIGDLRSLCVQAQDTPYADVSRIVESGLLLFLNYVVPFPLGSRVVCFDLVPGGLFIFDRGNVWKSPASISAIMKSLALAVSKGRKSKKDLVELLWGYAYHPMRHDPMLYALINRLRHALGDHSDWLVATAGDYELLEGIDVRVYEPREMMNTRILEPSRPLLPDSAPTSAYEGSTLNHRQMVILSELRRQAFLNAAQCAKLFGMSKVTATRDLIDLEKSGHVVRVGKARATHYKLKN